LPLCASAYGSASDAVVTASLLGASRLPEVKGHKPAKKKFKDYPIGYFHINIAEVQTAEGKLYLYVAIDRTSKFTVVHLVERTGRTSVSAVVARVIKGSLQDSHRADG